MFVVPLFYDSKYSGGTCYCAIPNMYYLSSSFIDEEFPWSVFELIESAPSSSPLTTFSERLSWNEAYDIYFLRGA